MFSLPLLSRFQIPLDVYEDSVCSMSKQTQEAELIRRTVLVVWDEAPMTHRHSIEAVDRLFRDIMGNDEPFGGKTVVTSGDFRQVTGTCTQSFDFGECRPSRAVTVHVSHCPLFSSRLCAVNLKYLLLVTNHFPGLARRPTWDSPGHRGRGLPEFRPMAAC